MKPNIQIIDNHLIFNEVPSDKIGLAYYCKSFKIHLNDIKIIAISPRLVLDDEVAFLQIIDNKYQKHLIPIIYVELTIINDLFNIQIHKEWGDFEEEEHYGTVDKILYPNDLYWDDLYENDWKLKLRSCYSWIIPKSFFGTLNKKITNSNI